MGGIEAYLARNGRPIPLHTNWEKLRFVSIDLESTGLDPRRDSIVSMAGIGLVNSEIALWDQFSDMLPVRYNTASVTVHGITREESITGTDESTAVATFLEWMGDGVIVGHHIQHDLILLNAALERHHGILLRNVAVDTMESFLAVREAGGFAGRPAPCGFSLDSLCDHFEIPPHDRHTASGDAYLTAQIFLRILKEAGKRGQWNLEDLHAWKASEPFPWNVGNSP